MRMTALDPIGSLSTRRFCNWGHHSAFFHFAPAGASHSLCMQHNETVVMHPTERLLYSGMPCDTWVFSNGGSCMARTIAWLQHQDRMTPQCRVLVHEDGTGKPVLRLASIITKTSHSTDTNISHHQPGATPISHGPCVWGTLLCWREAAKLEGNTTPQHTTTRTVSRCNIRALPVLAYSM